MIEKPEMIPPPPRWGEDAFTYLLHSAHNNQYVTFAKKKGSVGKIIAIDACFMEIVKDWLNPADRLAALLFFRAHAAYRVAAGCALAGQVAEMFPLLRIAIEYGAYGLHINRNNLGEVWLRRHDSDEARKRVLDEFKVHKLKATIKAADRHLEKTFTTLYEQSIDYGGHPNERGVTTSTKLRKEKDRTFYDQVYLHDDGPILDAALRRVAQHGVCVLLLFQEVFRPRFELLGVRHRLLELRKGL